jgi:TM2 domain-containing membrane protein YozV
MSTNWFLQHNGKTHGPLTSVQLKQLAASGKINRDTQVRMNDDGQWTQAAKVRGLFPDIAAPPPVAMIAQPPVLRSEGLPQNITEAPVRANVIITKPCIFCGEEIAASALKCRFCNEFLDGRPRETAQQPVVQHVMPQTAVHVTNVTNVRMGYKAWSPVVAAILSLILPGLGQLYKGQPINGLVWFLVVVAGYATLIFPGLVLHLCCVLGAMMGNPHR